MAVINTGQKWTIISVDGGTVIDFDVFMNVDVNSENQVTQSPVEGGFVDYNRVISPTSVGLMLGVKGNSETLQRTLDQINALCNSTQLVNIVTPWQEFKNYALEKMQFSQDASSGLDVLYFDLGFTEVKEVTTAYSNARVASRKSRGQQQTKETSIMKAGITGLFS